VCHDLLIVMLNVIMLSVVILSVIILSVVMLNVVAHLHPFTVLPDVCEQALIEPPWVEHLAGLHFERGPVHKY